MVPAPQLHQPPVVADSKSLSAMMFGPTPEGAENEILSTLAPPPLNRTNTSCVPLVGAQWIETVFIVDQSPVGARGTVATGALPRLPK